MITDRGLSVNAETDDTKKSTKKTKQKQKNAKTCLLKHFRRKRPQFLRIKADSF